jgi:DNA-binding MarR family transcriptional regulator
MKQSTAQEKLALKKAMALMNIFIKLRETMPAQYIKAFLLVAQDEGQNVKTYADRAGIDNALMTRHLQDLSDVNRAHEEGFKIVEQYKNVMDRRNMHTRLSAKGRAMVDAIHNALTG